MGTRKGGAPGEGVSHEWTSSREYLMGERTRWKPGGAARWEINENSHDCNTPGPLINRGYSSISQGKPVPKRDWPWEPPSAISGPLRRVKPPPGPGRGGSEFYTPMGDCFSLACENLPNSKTISIRTAGRAWKASKA